MAFPGQVAVDASAVRGADRPRANLATDQQAKARDFRSATAEHEHLILPARRDELGSRRAQRPRDAWQKAGCRTLLQVVRVRPAAQLLRTAPLQAHADESELLQAQSLPVQQALWPATPLPAQEPAPCVPLERRLRALPPQLAWPRAQREPRAHSVSRRLVPRLLGEVPQARQVSTARPSQLLPSLLFLHSQPLPIALRLPRLLESFCAPFQRRPQGSNSSASSFP